MSREPRDVFGVADAELQRKRARYSSATASRGNSRKGPAGGTPAHNPLAKAAGEDRRRGSPRRLRAARLVAAEAAEPLARRQRCHRSTSTSSRVRASATKRRPSRFALAAGNRESAGFLPFAMPVQKRRSTPPRSGRWRFPVRWSWRHPTLEGKPLPHGDGDAFATRPLSFTNIDPAPFHTVYMVNWLRRPTGPCR